MANDPDLPLPVIRAVHLPGVTGLAGMVDSSWRDSAPQYPLYVPGGDSSLQPQEEGSVQLAWNRNGLLVAFECTDRVVIQDSQADQQWHYRHGDVFELFLKPRRGNCLWEMYATPYGHKTTLFLSPAGRGMSLTDPLTGHPFAGMTEVRADIRTPEGREAGWGAEMWVPARRVQTFGDAWGPEGDWTVLASRYNYSEAGGEPELSAHPRLSQADFHNYAEHARLELLES